MGWMINYFRFAWKEVLGELFVRRHYYRDRRFACIDRALLKSYLFKSPYRISKEYLLKRKAKDVYVYGETPLPTLERIAKEAQLSSNDRVLDLGCGRGRGVFFFAHFYGAVVYGIEKIPFFIYLSKRIAHRFDINRVSFFCADMLKMPLPEVTMIYFYGTCLEDQEIREMIRRFKMLQTVRIVSVSYPLNDYDATQSFEIQKTFSVDFPWGTTTAYLQTLKT